MTAGTHAGRAFLAALAAALSLSVSGGARAANDAYQPPADQSGFSDSIRAAGQGTPPGAGSSSGAGDAYQPAPADAPAQTYEPYRPLDNSRRPAPPNSSGSYGSGSGGGYGEPYVDGPAQGAAANPREEHYEQVPPAEQGGPPETSSKYYSQDEIVRAGHSFFGKVSGGLASAVEWAFQKAGRPNGYILGQDAGGAIVAGVRYGEGTLYTKDAGNHKVYWQGPSLGYDFGAEGSKVMTLVYNMADPSDIYDRFGGVEGAAYLVGGVSVQLQKKNQVTLAPIRAGLGLRLGANVGYLKYSRKPTWNPF